MDDPVSRWVFPDEARRRAVHPEFFGVFLDGALRDGWVDVAEGHLAAALWLPAGGDAASGSDSAEPGDDVAALLARVAENDRGGIVGRLLDEAHPARPHYYLPIIAVAPGHQNRGLGRALLAPVLRRCDDEGMPAYLEASNERSKALYERLGFAFTGTPVELPDGPRMWPMWREPRS
ncbi:GNAT family N-acetyltransferase [Streptantibioticus parmotrematis]|uniref:GNAT family N-acetyltransferase n=1 Tax=Streptantibioticus parmotrematis TaxID=2873249 RepID=UPI0033FACD96